jgi:hypothetical protein
MQAISYQAGMSKRAFDKIMRGLEDARAYLDGSADKSRYRVHVPKKTNVRKTQMRLPNAAPDADKKSRRR